MPKTIVLLLDGTANEIEQSRTNILRLYGSLVKDDQQLVYYDPGVGTFGGDVWLSRVGQKASEVVGMITGRGLDVNVKQAYQFLVENYEYIDKDNHDRLYIFGFSRGAYTARVLAGFLHSFGLMDARNLNLLDYAYRAYQRIGESEHKAFDEIDIHSRVIRPHLIPIDGLGLFDSVSSVFRWRRWIWRLWNHAFTRKNTSVRAVRHAVAISERRTMFRAQLWQKGQTFRRNKYKKSPDDPLQDVKEVWFEGVHGDIGGGYPEPQSSLAKIPLYWMIKETEGDQGWGLRYRPSTLKTVVNGQQPSRKYVEPNALGRVNWSMTWFWPVVELIPRRRPPLSARKPVFGLIMPLFERRLIPKGATIHASVLERTTEPYRLPPNLPTPYETEPWSEGAIGSKTNSDDG